MKKIVPFLILIMAVTSCSEDVKFNNNAAFQCVVNNVFFKGSSAKAERNAGSVTIQAVSFTEVIKMKVPIPPTTVNPKDDRTYVNYPLGTSTARTAFYSVATADGTQEFKTGIGVGDGQVVISEYNGSVISGTFRFNAKSTDPDSDETVNVQGGFFYKVPVVDAP